MTKIVGDKSGLGFWNIIDDGTSRLSSTEYHQAYIKVLKMYITRCLISPVAQGTCGAWSNDSRLFVKNSETYCYKYPLEYD
ncbi:2632_t:CDS:2 [Funneliformis geosporum]|uniref:18542_t:CDS:1 n=1 Tax=Funneliformis geosporum TaxID=1117311 RepID=A0A9W4SHJ1_9GLOM|nr:18542_t:CDS:2 [Funneliformis geosporum]CAI2171105.1 2632_t:CDS:2 [Funneliformis geosporum]